MKRLNKITKGERAIINVLTAYKAAFPVILNAVVPDRAGLNHLLIGEFLWLDFKSSNFKSKNSVA